ncbi:MAG TPA: pyridoxal-phosphate dependent enzyme [Gemmatimonadales bacterium]|nr:pyridoxal-phosphate dependent enzyme [Gemmatimonadales bacterium]
MSDPSQLTKKIRAALAPCGLGEWPTPLEPAPALARHLGLVELAVKREDRSAARYGGNKVRGLEFLLAGAAPGTTFVTLGGTGSTHCLATAMHAAALGHQTAVAQFPQPETPASRSVAAACAARATLVVRAPARAMLPLAVLEAWHRARVLGPGPRRWIPGGGAHPSAVVGHLLAGLELALQVTTPPDAIVVPLGTGGTAAGLLLALGTLGWETRLVGVRVAPAVVANRWRTLRMARAARRLLKRAGVTLAAPTSPVVIDRVGRGYGWPTIDGEAARRLAGEQGLILDSTYGAKAFGFLLRRGTWNVRRVVFWHTFAVPESTLERAP